MKKLLLVLIALPMIGFGQFPGKDVNLLLNKELKVLPKAESLHEYGYDYFFKNKKMKKKYACCDSYNSKYKALVNKVFKVINIEPYNSDYKLLLENDETGTVYFKYSTRFKHSFPFEVIGGLDYPAGFFCKDIKKTEDKFNNEVTYRSPLLEDLNFTKFVKNDNIVYYLSCNTIGSTVVVDGKGVILLLDNGEKIEWSEEKIDVKVSSGGNYVYSCFIRLSSEDIAKLQQNNISDFRLYIFDNKVENSEKYKQYINCMVEQE